MLLQIIATIIIVALWGFCYTIITGSAPILSGYAAGLQFQNSDTTALVSTTAMHYIGNTVQVPSILAIVALLFTWVPYIDRKLLPAALLAIGLGSANAPAHAYYDKSDYAEAYTILPNESALGARHWRQQRQSRAVRLRSIWRPTSWRSSGSSCHTRSCKAPAASLTFMCLPEG